MLAFVTRSRVPSSTSLPRSTDVFAGPVSADPACAGGGAAGKNVCVNVIATVTGLPPNVPGWNLNCCAAAVTASSNGGCGGVTRSTLMTAPVGSTRSFTVTATGTVIAGAPSGYATSVLVIALGASNCAGVAAEPPPASLPSLPAACACATLHSSASRIAILNAT